MNTTLSVLTAALAAAALWVGCPATSECQGLLDCPQGEVCNAEGECVPEPDLGEGEGEPPDAGVGEGEGEGPDAGTPLDDITVQLLAPATLLLESPFAAGDAVLATSGGGEEDVLRSFDKSADVTSTDDMTTVRDFLQVAPAPSSCALESFAVFSAATLGLPNDETWWSCRTPPTVRIQYEDDPGGTQLYDDSGIGALEVFRSYTSTDNPQVLGRVAYARRDGPFNVVQLGQGDGARQQRVFDDTADLGLDNVAAIYTLVTDHPQLGDVLLVYDRGPDGDEQRLVPVQRQLAGDSWSTEVVNAVGYGPLTLPPETHFALFLEAAAGGGVEDPTNLTAISDTTADRPNIALLQPTEGKVVFMRLEVELQSAGTSGFQELLIGGQRPAQNPPAEDRVLVSPYVSGGRLFLFYALSHEPFAWRLPMHGSRNDNLSDAVLGAVENDSEVYRGIVAVDGVTAWLAGTQNGQGFLARRGFTEGGR